MSLFGVFVSCSFSGRVWGGLGGPLGAIGVDLEGIWTHFGDFFRLRGIFKNICFTIVKLYFLRIGGFQVGDFFLASFLCLFLDPLFMALVDFLWSNGRHEGPNGPPLGTSSSATCVS